MRRLILEHCHIGNPVWIEQLWAIELSTGQSEERRQLAEKARLVGNLPFGAIGAPRSGPPAGPAPERLRAPNTVQYQVVVHVE